MFTGKRVETIVVVFFEGKYLFLLKICFGGGTDGCCVCGIPCDCCQSNGGVDRG